MYPPIKPVEKQETMIDMFILAALIHLFTIGGIIQTTSLYPSAPSPIPSPGVISWTAYLIPPNIPIPNINFPSSDGSEPPVLEQVVNDSVSTLTPTPQYVDSDTDILGNQVSDGTVLQDVIDETIPDDVIDEELENILPDFIQQLEMGGTKCK